jgi:hypothetical protein
MSWEETALSSENKRLKTQLKEYELINKHHIELIGRLEEQLKAIKYLDRDTLEDFFVRYADDIGGVTGASLLVWDSPAFDKVIIEILKLAIPKQKYLDRQGVEEIIWTLSDGLKFWYQNKAGTSGQNILYSENLVLEAIAAICKLTIIEVKTLDRAEVEKITDKHLGTLSDHSNLVTDILKLAIPSREKIMGIPVVKRDDVPSGIVYVCNDEILGEDESN